jgi:hypothetical protein
MVSEILDPGSEKILFLIPDPGVKKAPDHGSVSAKLCPSMNLLYTYCNCMRGGDHNSQHPQMFTVKQIFAKLYYYFIENCNCRPLVHIYFSFRMFPKLFTHR